MKKIALFLIALIIIIDLFPTSVSAHSGRTDSNGCHHCWTGSCYGEYHCHKNTSSSSTSSSAEKKNSTSSSSSDESWMVILIIMLIGTGGSSIYLYKTNKELHSIQKNNLAYIERLKIDNKTLTEDKKELIKTTRKLKNEIDTYKYRVDYIAQQRIDNWFAERYKGRLNPYTGRPILSEKDFNEYLEQYKNRHDGESHY